MVIHQLDADVAFGQQLHVVIKLARGDRAGARLLDLRRAGGAHALVQIGRRDREPVLVSLDKKVRQDGNGGLALDHALRSGELAEKILAADADLHGSCGFFLLDSNRHAGFSHYGLAQIYTTNGAAQKGMAAQITRFYCVASL